MGNTATWNIPEPVEPASEAARRDRSYRAVAYHISQLLGPRVSELLAEQREQLAALVETTVIEPPAPLSTPDGTPAEEPPVANERESLAAAVRGAALPTLTLDQTMGKDLLAGITEIIFTAALRDGYFRFPDGYGSFRVQRLTENPKPKRLPTGDVVPMPANRVKFKYEDGAAVREVLGLSKKTNYIRRHPRGTRLADHTKELLLAKRDEE